LNWRNYEENILDFIAGDASSRCHCWSAGSNNFQDSTKRRARPEAQLINGKFTVVSTGVGDNIRDFQFLDENHGWAVTRHSVLKTTDGGQTWMEIRTAPNHKVSEHYAPQETMEKVQFLSQAEGWAVEGSHLIHTVDVALRGKALSRQRYY